MSLSACSAMVASPSGERSNLAIAWIVSPANSPEGSGTSQVGVAGQRTSAVANRGARIRANILRIAASASSVARDELACAAGRFRQAAQHAFGRRAADARPRTPAAWRRRAASITPVAFQTSPSVMMSTSAAQRLVADREHLAQRRLHFGAAHVRVDAADRFGERANVRRRRPCTRPAVRCSCRRSEARERRRGPPTRGSRRSGASRASQRRCCRPPSSPSSRPATSR